MKKTILNKTADIFLKFGFKSVTMDDIAHELGVSKKTLYKYFDNKEDLVNQALTNAHQKWVSDINNICGLGYNAIQENFAINKYFRELLQHLDDSPIYQLKKYYPDVAERILKDEYSAFLECISNNMKKGIEEGLYQKNIEINIISKLYHLMVMGIHDNNTFIYRKNSIQKLEIEILKYHTRAIATKKGLKELETQLAEINNN
ncbi:MAG TPA: TetR/AcrR family transcriptional regulator [Flavobacteriaceae bacterium]|nr:TetR/AcrR family transcriptional regulator [Flavobacteriaceae bacterium]